MAKRHPREYIINPTHSFDPSTQFMASQVVETPDGEGVIVEQDSCEESFPSGKFQVWLDRWGIKFDGSKEVKYYPVSSITAKVPDRPPVGTHAFTAQLMAEIMPADDDDPDFWDRWKDEMKDASLGL